MFCVEIIMVRLQGDFAKPPEKRLNYKNCIDGLYRVRRSFVHVAMQARRSTFDVRLITTDVCALFPH